LYFRVAAERVRVSGAVCPLTRSGQAGVGGPRPAWRLPGQRAGRDCAASWVFCVRRCPVDGPVPGPGGGHAGRPGWRCVCR